MLAMSESVRPAVCRRRSNPRRGVVRDYRRAQVISFVRIAQGDKARDPHLVGLLARPFLGPADVFHLESNRALEPNRLLLLLFHLLLLHQPILLLSGPVLGRSLALPPPQRLLLLGLPSALPQPSPELLKPCNDVDACAEDAARTDQSERPLLEVRPELSNLTQGKSYQQEQRYREKDS